MCLCGYACVGARWHCGRLALTREGAAQNRLFDLELPFTVWDDPNDSVTDTRGASLSASERRAGREAERESHTYMAVACLRQPGPQELPEDDADDDATSRLEVQYFVLRVDRCNMFPFLHPHGTLFAKATAVDEDDETLQPDDKQGLHAWWDSVRRAPFSPAAAAVVVALAD